MEDKELKKKIIAEAKPLLDKINALKKEVGEADEQEEQEMKAPSSGVKEWLAAKKSGLFQGKSLSKEPETEFTETADFTGKKL